MFLYCNWCSNCQSWVGALIITWPWDLIHLTFLRLDVHYGTYSFIPQRGSGSCPEEDKKVLTVRETRVRIGCRCWAKGQIKTGRWTHLLREESMQVKTRNKAHCFNRFYFPIPEQILLLSCPPSFWLFVLICIKLLEVFSWSEHTPSIRHITKFLFHIEVFVWNKFINLFVAFFLFKKSFPFLQIKNICFIFLTLVI